MVLKICVSSHPVEDLEYRQQGMAATGEDLNGEVAAYWPYRQCRSYLAWRRSSENAGGQHLATPPRLNAPDGG